MFIRNHSMRRLMIVAAVTLPALALLAFIWLRPPPLLLYNHTPSLPLGFYRYQGGAIRRGDIVAFLLPRSAWDYARRRGDNPHLILIKRVLAVGGDPVSTLHGQLRINGRSIGAIAATDAAGRTLPQWRADRLLRSDELLVGTRHRHSFDSRYFGPIHTNQVIGVYRSLWTASAPPEPLLSGSTEIHSSGSIDRREKGFIRNAR